MMRRCFEFVLILFLVICICFVSNVFILLGAAKNTFDSFDNNIKVGLVVRDTSSLNSTYEQPIYNILTSGGVIVTKIDTTTMDVAIYNDGGNNWNTFDAIVICGKTDSATVDTSVVNGIGDVPVLILEPQYFSNFGFPDSTGTVNQDSFMVNDTTTFITNVWADNDTIRVALANQTLAKIGGSGLTATNALITTMDGADTVAVFDTLNGQSRAALSLNESNTWLYGGKQTSIAEERNLILLFNRMLSRLVGTYTDSLFSFGLLNLSGTINQGDGQEGMYNHLAINGHDVVVVDNAFGDSTWYNWPDSTDWDSLSAVVLLHTAGNDIDSLVDGTKTNISIFDTWSVNETGISIAQPQSTVEVDSIKITNISSSVFSGVFSLNDSIKVFATDTLMKQFDILELSTSGIELARVVGASSKIVVAIHKSKKRSFCGLGFDSNGFADKLNANGWKVWDRLFGWGFEAKPLAPTDVAMTAVNTDSMKITWADNATGEDGYSVFIIQPDSAYFSHLGSNAVSDTLFPFWPPSSRIIADVAVISGTDTVFSSTGRDTAWTLAAIPPSPFTKNLTDTSMSFFVNGFLFDERFDDEDFTSDPVWTVQSGSFEVDTLKRQLRNTTDPVPTGSSISTPFKDVSGDSLNDGEWFFSFKFSDSTAATNQSLKLHFMNNKNTLDSTGYQMEIQGDGDIFLIRTDDPGSVTLVSANVAISSSEIFKWHTIKIVRDFNGSPQDTSVTFTVYLDGDSTMSASDKTYFTSDFLGIRVFSDTSDIRIDDIQFRQQRPSANHDSTHYAVQDSVTSKYVQDSSDQLGVSEDWRTWIEWGAANGDTLSFLKPDSSVVLRSKARNEWQ